MTQLWTIVQGLHIAAGSVALLTFWLPWVVKKGGRTHRRAGFAFVASMAVVSVSAWAACAIRLADTDVSNDGGAIFLAYVGLLSAANASLGLRAIRTKRRAGASRHPWDLGMAALLLVAGLALIGYAAANERLLFGIFGAIGAAIAALHLRFWLRPPRSKLAWMFEHLNNMGAACIAALTALLVVNARVFGLPKTSLLVWVTPSIVGAIVLFAANIRYGNRFRASGRQAAAMAETNTAAFSGREGP